jgi:precorrin-3B C17-methyltransferase
MGKIYIVGIGPGSREHISLRASEIIEKADIVVGYTTYVRLLEKEFTLREVFVSGMRGEADRCRRALEFALAGKTVALVSSGDAGVYGMAGIMLEIIKESGKTIETEVIPGITSASASAALLGAPLMHDFATISLSDLLTDHALIQKRLEAAASADFVICLYNPKSRTRVAGLSEARDIVLKHRQGSTPVGIVKDAMREGESVIIADLDTMLNFDADMTTTIIIGNSQTFVSGGRMITPRGYEL